MIFKKNIAENLEDKIIDLMSKHKENLNFDAKATEARNKSYKANDHMLGGLMVAGAGMVAGVGGLAASLHLGFGAGALAIAGAAAGMTVGGAILVGGVIGIGGPALAYMGISKLVKMYHESVENKNYSMGGYVKAEHSVRSDFSKKLEKVLGGRDSDLYNEAYKSGLVNDLKNSSGYSIEYNTKKLLELSSEMSKVSTNKDENKRVQNFRDSLKNV
jgi:hypothetical protein